MQRAAPSGQVACGESTRGIRERRIVERTDGEMGLSVSGHDDLFLVVIRDL